MKTTGCGVGEFKAFHVLKKVQKNIDWLYHIIQTGTLLRMKEGSSNNFSRTRSPRQVKKYGYLGKLSCSPEKQRASVLTWTHILTSKPQQELGSSRGGNGLHCSNGSEKNGLHCFNGSAKISFIALPGKNAIYFYCKKNYKVSEGTNHKVLWLFNIHVGLYFLSFSTLLCVYVYWCLFYIGDCIYLLFSLLLT